MATDLIDAVWNEAHGAHTPAVRAHLGAIEPAQDVAARGDVLHAALVADPAVRLHDVEDHGLGPVLAVHDPALVDFLTNVVERWQARGLPLGDRPAIVPWAFPNPRLAPAGPLPPATDVLAQLGEFCADTLTVVLPGTWTAALGAAHAAVTAADLLATTRGLTYAAVRPPGHHAGTRTYGGACFLNNAAIAAQRLASGRRVAIVDVDAHHGNGTQEIFYDREDVFYASLHADPAHEYPYWCGFAQERGTGPGVGATRNEPLPPGCSDEVWLAALERLVQEVDSFAPDVVVVSLGVDGLAEDNNSFLSLTPAAYAHAGRVLGELRRPMVCIQEGGYVLPLLGDTVLGFLHAAAGS